MATCKGLLLDSLEGTGERADDLICFYEPHQRDAFGVQSPSVLLRATVEDLPTREFDASYGEVEGESMIAFGPKYVYIKGCYDGREWVEAIPRHPEYVTQGIPCVGGGC